MKQIARRLSLLPSRSAHDHKRSYESFLKIQRLEARLAKLRGVEPEPIVYPSRQQPDPHREMSMPQSGFKMVLWVKQNGRCQYCRGSLLPRYHVDHIHPKSKGGPNHPSNYCLACQPCNLAKKDKSAIDFMMQLTRARII
jgi:5-methylcytosine-specific restriction endonuclease McrA